MFSKLAVICAMEAEGLLKQPTKRSYWVHPNNSDRESSERFQKFFKKIRMNEKMFFERYRMSVHSFDELLDIIRPYITKQNTNWRISISAEERLSVTLRYLATGINFAGLQHEVKIAKSTIAILVRETCQTIWSCLKDTEMPEPTEEKWLEIAETFHTKTNFPNCIGSIDGKHVRCRNPRKSGSNYVSHKGFFSVVLMAVADADFNFVAIEVGAYGKEGCSYEFRDSALGKRLYTGQLSLPTPRCLPNTSSKPQPFVMVGDEAFKINTNLLRPFPPRDLNPRRRVFNYRLSRCRRSVECAFGVMSDKWRVFHTPILVWQDFVEDIVKACCILHNFVLKRDGVIIDGTENYPFVDVKDCGRGERQKGNEVRDFFADYFMGPGAVPFQKDHMYKRY